MDNVRDQAVILMNGRGVSCRELVEPKLAELNRNFEKVSQHIKSAKVRMSEPQSLLGRSVPRRWQLTVVDRSLSLCHYVCLLEQHFAAYQFSKCRYLYVKNRVIFKPAAFFT